MKPHQKVGHITRQLCWLFDGIIIGGSVDYISGYSQIKPKDIDIIIPLDRWVKASQIIPSSANVNSFGGFKFMDGDFEIDVWADDIGRVLTAFNKNSKAYNIVTNKIISVS